MTGKLIIIEGVDGSGKSTLIEALRCKGIPDYIFNYSYPKEASIWQDGAFAKGEYFASIRIFKQLMGQGKTIVCDRFHLGEYAYGLAMRNYPLWFAEKIQEDVEEFMIRELGVDNIIVILLQCNPSSILLRKGKYIANEYPKEGYEFYSINSNYITAVKRSILHGIGLWTDSEELNNRPKLLLMEVLHWIEWINKRGIQC